MHALKHKCIRPELAANHGLRGKLVYIPAMAEGSVEAMAAVFGWLGIEARRTPPSDARTLELGARYTSGDECYPAKITIGDLVKIVEQPGFDAGRTVYFMATAGGPCRFGQYAPFIRKLLRELGYGEVQIYSPQTDSGYSNIGELGSGFIRMAWRALVGADILRKLLLQTRPYESVPGAADEAFHQSIQDLCHTVENSCCDSDCQMGGLLACLLRGRRRFRDVAADYDPERPLIGVVGEIFCRLNNFSNEDLVRKLESHGAECWMTDISEWIEYTNQEEVLDLRLQGRSFSWKMLKSKLRAHMQHSDLEALTAPFEEDFAGTEEPGIEEVLELAQAYLRRPGSEGEMVVSAGKSAYLARHGADGIVDISPFTCMNGIVSEAIYPKLSRDHGGIPIRNFYFDGTRSDLENDVGVFLELARSYRKTKAYRRRYASRFSQAVTEHC